MFFTKKDYNPEDKAQRLEDIRENRVVDKISPGETKSTQQARELKPNS